MSVPQYVSGNNTFVGGGFAMSTALRITVVALLSLGMTGRAAGAADRTFQPGSLIIPMDLSYQSTGMFQAYGLIYQLLRQGVHVQWMINPAKTYHAAACNTPGDLCAWDCAIEGSGIKCPYPTATPDVTVTTKIVWDDRGVAARGDALGTHRYRGGPFVVDAADHDKALAIIDAWNDKTKWAGSPWAMRSVFHPVSVHEATAAFTGTVGKEMLAAPTIAVFADGNEDIATGYLLAAGIPQSSGAEFPGKCGTSDCGPGTANPDMLTEEAIAGDLGTCAAPNRDHHNGALFKPNGAPAYCQIMSMHWGVADRETVKCDGGACPATQAQCTNQRFTFNGHEVVAEVREFLKSNTHFYAECQAVNAYENTTPNPAWPFLDDEGRDGHFLTTRGTPPACPCTNTDYSCVAGGCNGTDCCLAKEIQRGAGYEIAGTPDATTLKVLRPDLPYSQFDGMLGTVGGSEPSYNLSSYLGTMYKNNRQVTLITGVNGPGNEDLWMTGYLDGCDDIIFFGERSSRAAGCGGKISYLGGHQYKTDVPLASGSDSQGTRLFLNALFEAQCVNGEGAGGGGDPDTDGDGVADSADPFPDDPTRCGDSDQDGCDDCASGHFDLANSCGGTPGQGGCCQTGATGAASPLGLLVLAGFVVLVIVRPRRRR